MKKAFRSLGIISTILLLVGVYCFLPDQKIEIQEYKAVKRAPRIDPDYAGTVIPPNIAPLNFSVNEPGARYQVIIHSAAGEKIEINSQKPQIRIPIDRWKQLLNVNRGHDLLFDVYVANQQGQWQRFDSITNQIAREEIDGCVVYRLLEPVFTFWNKMGIFQRNLENYNESPIFLNRLTNDNCMNCHSFCNNNPNRMIFHMRGGAASGMLMARDGKIVKVNTSTKFNRAGAYPSWHPNGKILALSANKISQIFHAWGVNREVIDKGSDLILYLIDSNIITTTPQISDPERMETFPAWSPDGQYLYFCSAPNFETYADEYGGVAYDQIQYDLMRISYDPENGSWGELEKIVAAAETGLSTAMPRISPDGRFLLFSMFKYGAFPIHLSDCDLYVMDIKTGQYHRLASNSDQSDSFHSWSHNSRWIVFSSKRRDMDCARLYFSYIDTTGKAAKPFLLPQEDPAFYENFIKTYNVPEMIKEPVQIHWRHLLEAALDQSGTLQASLDPNVKLSPVPSEKMDDTEWRPGPK